VVSQTVVLLLIGDKNWKTVNRKICYAPIFLFEATILLVKWHVSHPWLSPVKDVWNLMNSVRLYSFFWLIPRRLNFICRRFRNSSHYLWRWNSVPIRLHIKLKRWGITQKIEYYIHNKAKVWNQTKFCYILTVIPTANLVAAYSICRCHSKSLTYTLAKVRSVAKKTLLLIM